MHDGVALFLKKGKIFIPEPVMTIHGGLERHIKYGSLINLTCEILHYPGELNFIVWYRGDKSLMRNSRYNIRYVSIVQCNAVAACIVLLLA